MFSPSAEHGGAATCWPWRPEAPPAPPPYTQVTPALSCPPPTQHGGSGARPWAEGTHGVSGFAGAWRGGSLVLSEQIAVRSRHHWAPSCLAPACCCLPQNDGGCSPCPGWGASGSLTCHPLATLRHLRTKNEEGRLGGRLLPAARSRAVFTSFFSFSFLLPSWLSMKRPRAAGGWAAWPPPSSPPSLRVSAASRS